MKKNCTFILAAALALVLCIGLTACGGAQTSSADPDASQITETRDAGGVLRLKVNPEIAVTYDADGLVTSVDSRNEDAKALLANYTGFEGKECRTVVSELVTAIGEAGYFVEEVEGESRQITIEIESGSALPSETFLEEVVSDVRTTVSSNDWTSQIQSADNSAAPAVPSAPAAGTATIGSDGSLSYTGGTDYIDTDYGPNNDGITDYDNSVNDDSDYGPDSDGVTDYDDYDGTDYGPNGDGNTDYNDSDYGLYGDGVTDYTPAPAPGTSNGNFNYGSNYGSSSGSSNYGSNYGSSNYDGGSSNYGDSGYDD